MTQSQRTQNNHARSGTICLLPECYPKGFIFHNSVIIDIGTGMGPPETTDNALTPRWRTESVATVAAENATGRLSVLHERFPLNEASSGVGVSRGCREVVGRAVLLP